MQFNRYKDNVKRIALKERIEELSQELFWVRLRQQQLRERPLWHLHKYLQYPYLWYGERQLTQLIAQHRRQLLNLNNHHKPNQNGYTYTLTGQPHR